MDQKNMYQTLMEYTVITADNFQSFSWSGGTTKELFIFPPTADYQQRNFQFRLSTATVEAEKADFTPLSGVSRKLMVLEGKITISHVDHHSRQLHKFEVDTFEGDWKTSSIGKCIDFNLMTTGRAIGELNAMDLKKEQSINYKIKNNCDWFFMYLYAGTVRTDINNQIVTINKGDLLVLHQPTIPNLRMNGIEKSELIFSEITERYL